MKTQIAFAAVVAASCVLAGCQRVSDFAELECTAHETGLVTDCVLLRSSHRDFGEMALEEASERGTRPYLDPATIPEPAAASEPGDPEMIADAVANIHPGYDGRLPRRFRTTIRVSY